jgi:Phosphatidylinositol-specific phospholipase C, X domain
MKNIFTQLTAALVATVTACALPSHSDAAEANVNNTKWPTGYNVQFGLSREYDTGVQTSNALHSSGLVLEFHKSQANSGIWYRVGKLLGTTVKWGNTQAAGTNGYWPAVAISKEGYVIVVYSNSSYGWGSEQFYQVGTINPNGDENQSINWKRTGLNWDGGFHTSIAMNDKGVIVSVHESNSLSNNQLYYRVGHFRNPAGGDFTVAWDSGNLGNAYDVGINPHIAINNANQVVQVHQVPGSALLHYRRGIVSGGKINFGESQRYDNAADRPAVALLDNGTVLEMHCSGGLSSRTGKLNPSNSAIIDWSDCELLEKDTGSDGIVNPAISTNGSFAIQTHQKDPTSSLFSPKLYFSTSAIRDRGNWMRDNLSWLGNYSLQNIVIPGSHDAGMYKGDLNGSLALTQDQSFYYQLHGGVRYFDVRVLAGSPQYIYHGSAAFKGPPLQEVLDDVKNFMNERGTEAVVLKFSHFLNFGQRDYSELANSIYNTLGPWLYQGAMTGVHPARVPLKELLGTGGKVIVVMDGGDAVADFLFQYKDWYADNPQGLFTVYDEYSNTTNYDNMKTDQIRKYNDFNGTMKHNKDLECELFLLSWTLTPITNVEFYSAEANRDLGEQMAYVLPNPFGLTPNILYVDYYERARVTDTAISMTQRFLNYKESPPQPAPRPQPGPGWGTPLPEA